MGCSLVIETMWRRSNDTAAAGGHGNRSRLPSRLFWDSGECSSKSRRSIDPGCPYVCNHGFRMRSCVTWARRFNTWESL
jgi:hypothetical protein